MSSNLPPIESDFWMAAQYPSQGNVEAQLSQLKLESWVGYVTLCVLKATFFENGSIREMNQTSYFSREQHGQLAQKNQIFSRSLWTAYPLHHSNSLIDILKTGQSENPTINS